MQFVDSDGAALAASFQAKASQALASASDLNQLRAAAKRALTEWPELIDQVITEAARFGGAGQKFGRFIESIRLELEQVSDQNRERFLTRAFHRKTQ